MKIRVDLDLCQGHGVCVEEAPELFALDPATNQVKILDASPPAELEAKLRAAVRYCPTKALRVGED